MHGGGTFYTPLDFTLTKVPHILVLKIDPDLYFIGFIGFANELNPKMLKLPTAT